MAHNFLLVDDSRTARAILRKTLSLAGLATGQVHEAANGKEALEILKSTPVDLVFANINMPLMGGVDMLAKMSERGLLGQIAVVVVTAEAESPKIEKLMELGVTAYVRKPFAPEAVRKLVSSILEADDGG